MEAPSTPRAQSQGPAGPSHPSVLRGFIASLSRWKALPESHHDLPNPNTPQRKCVNKRYLIFAVVISVVLAGITAGVAVPLVAKKRKDNAASPPATDLSSSELSDQVLVNLISQQQDGDINDLSRMVLSLSGDSSVFQLATRSSSNSTSTTSTTTAATINISPVQTQSQACTISQRVLQAIQQAKASAAGTSPAAAAVMAQVFNAWATVYDKSYTTGSLSADAFRAFMDNLQEVLSSNCDAAGQFWGSLNTYSDLTKDEFDAQVLMTPATVEERESDLQTFITSSAADNITRSAQGGGLDSWFPTDLAKSVDWMAAGKVPPVMTQGVCGCCWAHAAADAAASSLLINYDVNPGDVLLSRQQLVDCVNPQYGFKSAGCDGGLISEPLRYMQAKSLSLEAFYRPYSLAIGPCNLTVEGMSRPRDNVVRANPQRIEADGRVFPFFTPTCKDCTFTTRAALLARAVAQQPVAIYMNARSRNFINYAGGILTRTACTVTRDRPGLTDHAVTIVGYSVDDPANPYWILKNSWGTSWGINGLARLQMTWDDQFGTCNIYSLPIAPSLNWGLVPQQISLMATSSGSASSAARPSPSPQQQGSQTASTSGSSAAASPARSPPPRPPSPRPPPANRPV